MDVRFFKKIKRTGHLFHMEFADGMIHIPKLRVPVRSLNTKSMKIKLISIFVSSLLFCLASTAADKRPNILFIMSDDHGYQAISAYGSKVNKTPNIDRIANAGMRFDRCFVTNSICGPSRAVILTGKYSHLNGFATNGNRFNGEQQHVGKLLQTAGIKPRLLASGTWVRRRLDSTTITC